MPIIGGKYVSPNTRNRLSSGTSNSLTIQRNTYDTATGTYTDVSGNKYSYATPPAGSTIINSSLTIKKTSGGGGSSGGGYSYVDTTTGKGYEVSPEGIKKEITPISPARVNQNIRQENQLNNLQTSARDAQTQRDLRNIINQQNKSYVDLQRQQGTKINYNVKTYEDIQRENQLNKNILTVNPEYIKSTTYNVNKVITKLTDIASENEKVVDDINEITTVLKGYDKYIKGNEFVGTEEQYKEYKGIYGIYEKSLNKYNELQSKYNIETKKLEALGGSIDKQGYIKEPTIGVGYKVGRGSARQVPISEFSGLSNEYIAPSTSIDIIGKSLFSTSASGWKDILNTGGKVFGGKTDVSGNLILIPEKKTITYQPVQGTMQYFGKQGEQLSPFIKSEITLPATTSSDIENIIYKGGSGTVMYGKYLVPYFGAGLFASEVTGRVKESGGIISYVKEHPVEAGITGGIVLAGGVLSGVKFIKNKSIYNAVNRALESLNKVPIKSLTIIDEGAGRVSAVGYREVSGIKQQIKYYGEIKQTESGVKFIPEGKGVVVTSGVVQPDFVFGMNPEGWGGANLKLRAFVQTQGFELGAKGKNIFIRDIGNAKLYEELGTTTIIPKDSYFGISKVNKFGKTEINLLKQSRENIVYKDISLPLLNDRNMFFELNKNLGLKVSRREVGTIIKILKPEIEESAGITFIGGGKKSSEQFFTDLYANKISPEIKTKVILPKLSKVQDTLFNPINIKSENPLMVGGTGRVTSAYVGTGMYERTESISVINLPSISSKNLVNIKSEDINKVKTYSTNKAVNIIKDFIKPKEELKTNTIQQEFVKTKEETIQNYKLNQQLRQELKTKQAENQINKLNILEKINIKVSPKVIIKIKPNKIDKGLLGEGEESLFEVFGRRFGKFKELGTKKSEKEAKQLAKEFSLGTLGASTMIKKNEKNIEFNLGAGFIKSKVNPFIQVQERSKRLSSYGEKLEIRKSKKRRSFL